MKKPGTKVHMSETPVLRRRCQADSLEFIGSSAVEVESGRFPGVHWLASQTNSMSSGFSERPCLKGVRLRVMERTFNTLFRPPVRHRPLWAFVPTYVCAHTHTHTYYIQTTQHICTIFKKDSFYLWVSYSACAPEDRKGC